MGHPLGGLIAIEYARAYPDRTRAAMNLDGFWWGRPGEYPDAELVGELLRSSADAPPGYIEEQVAEWAFYKDEKCSARCCWCKSASPIRSRRRSGSTNSLAGFARVLSAELAELARTRPTVTFTRIDATHARVQEAPEPVSEFVRALPS